MIDNGVKVFPKLIDVFFGNQVFDPELWREHIYIYSKKCKAVRSYVKDKDCNSGIRGMEVVDNWKERRGDSKTYSSMRIMCGSGEI